MGLLERVKLYAAVMKAREEIRQSLESLKELLQVKFDSEEKITVIFRGEEDSVEEIIGISAHFDLGPDNKVELNIKEEKGIWWFIPVDRIIGLKRLKRSRS
jgi:hypothetical protein